jgi:hypothetical protein
VRIDHQCALITGIEAFLGINIHSDNRVEFDDTHQERVDTSLERNMSFNRYHGIDYYFIFRRLQSPSGESGDGNPLMYALKEMNGYRMGTACKSSLITRAKAIIQNPKVTLTADAIIPVTSSYDFCGDFANILGECLDIPVIQTDLVSKKTVSQVLTEVEATPPTINKNHIKRLYREQLKAWSKLPPNTKVTMKRVDKKIRPYFNHLIAPKIPSELNGKSVLVVDDLLASGNTMNRSITLLQKGGVHVTAGVCFLSGL